MPIAIDSWAHELAQQVAATTGWRASEVYLFLTNARRTRVRRDSIRSMLDLLVQARLDGESFLDVQQRFTQIVDSMEP